MTVKNSSKRVWYYDACALEYRKIIGEVITNHHTHKIQSLTSHLSLGEAYGNCIKKGTEQAEAFIELIDKLGSRLRVVGNDSIEKQFKRIKEEFPALSFTDAVHFATAIKNKCEKLRSTDDDLYGLDKKRVRAIGKEFSCGNFVIN